MQQYFYGLADYIRGRMGAGEAFTAYLSGEESDFCRLNGAKVRQAGSVKQSSMSLRLIDEKGKRSAAGTLVLSGDKSEDQNRITGMLTTLREQLAGLPEDPYLLYATDVRSSERREKSQLIDSRDVVGRIVGKAGRHDMVGIYASGGVQRGFANSFGQRNWYETHSFNFDWSFYLRADKAVKSGYAGFTWSDDDFARKVTTAEEQLSVLSKEPRTLSPGRYRVYLSPDALTEVTDMLSWGGFSLKAHRTKQAPLIKMSEGEARMHDSVTMLENTAGGISPDFNSSGFTKPAQVTLIDGGRYNESLASPRSAKEYQVPTNGAESSEQPQSIEIRPGSLSQVDITRELGEGLYINNLWYLNFSDRSACRVTGMTRFATFWVEKGKIAQPMNVMRFDESVLKLFGDKLVGLTKEREFMLSSSTYGSRSTGSWHLPGALVDDFSFTL